MMCASLVRRSSLLCAGILLNLSGARVLLAQGEGPPLTLSVAMGSARGSGPGRQAATLATGRLEAQVRLYSYRSTALLLSISGEASDGVEQRLGIPESPPSLTVPSLWGPTAGLGLAQQVGSVRAAFIAGNARYRWSTGGHFGDKGWITGRHVGAELTAFMTPKVGVFGSWRETRIGEIWGFPVRLRQIVGGFRFGL
jgi:hypothetical protein